MRLYHFTCAHAEACIRRDGALIPQVSWRRLDAVLLDAGQAMTGLWRAPAVVWLTDMERPSRHRLGLTSIVLQCDRTEYRFEVDTDAAEPWTAFAARHKANPEYLATLTGDPRRWFVATGRVPILLPQSVLDLGGAA